MIKASGNPNDLIMQLKAEKKNFEVRRTTKSTLIVFDNFKYMFADSHFKSEHLNLFQKIKAEVHGNIESKKLTVPAYQQSKYFDTGQFKPIGLGEFLKFENVLEFDVNKAYYQALKKFGYISQQFFDKCVGLPKNIRLALVGTLATQKTIFFYKEGELDSYEIKKDEILRRVFFQLVEFIDKVLDYFSKLAGDNFLFYWVDGIYLKNYERAEYHRDLISYEYDLDFSTERLKNLMVFNKGDYQSQIVIKKMDNTLKQFNLNNIFVTEQI